VTAKVKDILKVPNGALRFKPPGEVSEAKPGKRPPIKEGSFYKNIVKKVGLDAGQSEELVKIIKKAGQKLKAAYALPEEERDMKQVWRGFFTQVFTSLYKILREDQQGKFAAYVAEFREVQKKRRLYKGRPAKVHVPDETGQPRVINITAGITDDDETQVVGGDLKEGDRVIVGLLLNTHVKAKQSRSVFTTLFKRR